MKRLVVLIISLVLISTCLTGCLSDFFLLIPSNDDIGEPKEFTKNGFSILLTDKFHEEESQRGFDAYFVADFCGVVVLKEEFTLEKGLAEKSLEEYTASVIKNNGYTGITPQTKDGLWYYERTNSSSYARSYCYKGSDAFWIVQFLCDPSDAETLSDTFYLWAQSVEIK